MAQEAGKEMGLEGCGTRGGQGDGVGGVWHKRQARRWGGRGVAQEAGKEMGWEGCVSYCVNLLPPMSEGFVAEPLWLLYGRGLIHPAREAIQQLQQLVNDLQQNTTTPTQLETRPHNLPTQDVTTHTHTHKKKVETTLTQCDMFCDHTHMA